MYSLNMFVNHLGILFCFVLFFLKWMFRYLLISPSLFLLVITAWFLFWFVAGCSDSMCSFFSCFPQDWFLVSYHCGQKRCLKWKRSLPGPHPKPLVSVTLLWAFSKDLPALYPTPTCDLCWTRLEHLFGSRNWGVLLVVIRTAVWPSKWVEPRCLQSWYQGMWWDSRYSCRVLSNLSVDKSVSAYSPEWILGFSSAFLCPGCSSICQRGLSPPHRTPGLGHTSVAWPSPVSGQQTVLRPFLFC